MLRKWESTQKKGMFFRKNDSIFGLYKKNMKENQI